MGYFQRKVQTEGGVRPPTTIGVSKLEWLPFRVYQNIGSALFGFVTKHACDRQADGQTDGQNYDSQDRASIAASRGKNRFVLTCYDFFSFIMSQIHNLGLLKLTRFTTL